jgi:hypothetical protein
LEFAKKQRWTRLNAFLARLVQGTEIDYSWPTTLDAWLTKEGPKLAWLRTDKSPRAIWTFTAPSQAQGR